MPGNVSFFLRKSGLGSHKEYLCLNSGRSVSLLVHTGLGLVLSGWDRLNCPKPSTGKCLMAS